MARILVVEDEIGIREFISDTLELEGHEVEAHEGVQAARSALQRARFDLLLTDLKMPDGNGLELLAETRRRYPELPSLVLTAHGSISTAVEAMKLGALDFLQKPLEGPEQLCLLVSRALQIQDWIELEDRVRRESPALPPLGYGSQAMEDLERSISRVAPTTSTVLLLGESGTGKEVAARHLHAQSQRRDQPFVAINCAALAPDLLESELFGHEKGAFTGAEQLRRGRIELAHRGTFFFDEIGELRPDLQAKLLRVLQERRFERVGGTRSVEVDVRWVAATNRNLPERIQAGAFREDLYHRLAVFPLRLPPLRDRLEDLPPLAKALLARIAADLKRGPLRLSEEALERILHWSWPGNVRELENVLERAAILSDQEEISASDLWLEASRLVSTGARSLAEVEREAIQVALDSVGGNRRRAAQILEISERALYDKLRRIRDLEDDSP